MSSGEVFCGKKQDHIWKPHINMPVTANFERRFFQVSRLHNVGTQFGGFRIHGYQLSVIFARVY